MISSEWIAPLVAFLTCVVTLAGLLRRRHALPMDRPNERSLHQVEVPRVGGLGIMAGIGIGSLLLDARDFAWVLVAAGVLAGVSLWDDLRGVPALIRLLAHFAIAFVFLLTDGLTGWALILVTLLVVWMTNLYNFMDGADGLAGGMAVIGFGTLALAAWLNGANALAVSCAVIVAASLGFLVFNFPPASLFMGDVGSIPLGFLAAVLGIHGIREQVWPWTFPLLVFSPFIFDASVTLAKRVLQGERVWQAHRMHYYQRLVLMGFSHRKLALMAYGLMLGFAVSALVAWAFPQYAGWLLALSAATYFLIFLAIDWRWYAAREPQ